MPKGSPSPVWEVQKNLTKVSSPWSKPSQDLGKVFDFGEVEGERRVYLAYTSISLFISEGSQDRGSSRGGTKR